MHDSRTIEKNYQTIRKQLEAGTERPVSDRQLPSVIGVALFDIGESLDHIEIMLEQLMKDGTR